MEVNSFPVVSIRPIHVAAIGLRRTFSVFPY